MSSELPAEPPAESPAQTTDKPCLQPVEQTKSWIKTAQTGFRRIVSVFSIILLIWLIATLAIHRHTIVLESISVPKQLVESGLSPEIAMERLRDSILSEQENAKTEAKKTEVALPRSISNLQVEKIGLSVGDAAEFVRYYLPEDWKHEVSGEFTISKNVLFLRLRLNDHVIFVGSGSLDDSNVIDVLLARGASSIVQSVEPYVAASALLSRDQGAADLAAFKIILDPTSSAEIKSRAYNLAGIIAAKVGRLEDAIFDYQSAIALNSEFAAPHFGIGKVLLKRGDESGAIKQFELASEINPNISQPHFALGDIYYFHNSNTRAEAEFREAARLDPYNSRAHERLGDVLRSTQGADAAISEYRTAIHLDPNSETAHFGLALAWDDKKLPSESIAEFKLCLLLEPKSSVLYESLGDELMKINAFDEAISAYRKGLAIAASDHILTYNLGKALLASAPSLGKVAATAALQEACFLLSKIDTTNIDEPIMTSDIERYRGEVDKLLGPVGHCPPK